MCIHKLSQHQMWDLLRVMVYDFKGLVEEFLTPHSSYHLNLKRVNGSAIETLLSQLKHTTSGHLTRMNYDTAKATVFTRRQAKGKEAYRSTSLYIAQTKLTKKWILVSYTLVYLKRSHRCLVCPPRAGQEAKKAEVISKCRQNFWTKRFQRNPPNAYVENSAENLMTPEFRRENKVCSS